MIDHPNNEEVITIESYLGGASPLITEQLIGTLLVDRGIQAGTDIQDMEVRDRELLKADALLWAATTPSTVGGYEEQVGNFKTKQAGNTLTSADKAMLKRLARAIYRKWEESWPWPSGVVVINKGMRI